MDSFGSTHWSVVLAARESGSPAAAEALEKLCLAYWSPVYACARCRGLGHEDAADVTQSFFQRFLHEGYIRAVDPRRGRFRSFLLTAFNHFLSNETAKQMAQKRGGGRKLMPWEELTPEAQARFQPIDHRTPDATFDQQWAIQVFDRALDNLRSEQSARGKLVRFERLKCYLARSPQPGEITAIATALDLAENAIEVQIHRLRVRYGELLRAEVASTVAHPDDIPDELSFLRRALAS